MSPAPATASAPTRERLLDAARAVIVQRGYSAASVAAITEAAGLAAGTLYRHFAGREELFVELFVEVCAVEEAAMRAAGAELGPEASEVDRLERVLATFARRALRAPRLSWALIAEPVDPRVDAERIAYRARYAASVAASLEAAIAAGEIAPLDDDFAAAAIVGGCGEALVGPLAPTGPRGDAPLSHDARETVVASLRAFVRRAVGAAPA